MQKPVLYSGTKNASSWAMRAWLALRAADYDFDEIVVDIRRPQRHRNLAKMREIAPPGCVPILDTGSTIIFDSNAIMEFANDICGGKLLPQSLEERASARSIVAWQHSGLSGICKRISFESSFYPVKRSLSSVEQEQASLLFDHLEQLLKHHEAPFLFGEYSLADMALVPCASRLQSHQVNLTSHSRVAAWIHCLLNQHHVAEWFSEARKLYHVWLQDYDVAASATA